MFRYSSDDAKLGFPWVVKDYNTGPKPTFVITLKRVASALSNFLPQYPKFFTRLLLVLVPVFCLIVWSGFVSAKTLALIFITTFLGGLKMGAPIMDCPDGSVIDSEDQIWNAVYWGKKVCLYKRGDVKHELVKTVHLPVSCATCPGLGGPDMNWLFITTG